VKLSWLGEKTCFLYRSLAKNQGIVLKKNDCSKGFFDSRADVWHLIVMLKHHQEAAAASKFRAY
jgi:hypothetical protein